MHVHLPCNHAETPYLTPTAVTSENDGKMKRLGACISDARVLLARRGRPHHIPRWSWCGPSPLRPHIAVCAWPGLCCGCGGGGPDWNGPEIPLAENMGAAMPPALP